MVTCRPFVFFPLPDARGNVVEVIEYRGWKNNLRLTNGDVELVVTLDVGPRVIAYRLPGGVNVLKNYDEMMGGTGEAEWQIRGGHRFWLAPEDLTRTYFADNRPVKWEAIGTHACAIHTATRNRIRHPEGDGSAARREGHARRRDAARHQHRNGTDGTRPVGADRDGARRRGDHPATAEEESPAATRRTPNRRPTSRRTRS